MFPSNLLLLSVSNRFTWVQEIPTPQAFPPSTTPSFHLSSLQACQKSWLRPSQQAWQETFWGKAHIRCRSHVFGLWLCIIFLRVTRVSIVKAKFGNRKFKLNAGIHRCCWWKGANSFSLCSAVCITWLYLFHLLFKLTANDGHYRGRKINASCIVSIKTKYHCCFFDQVHV